MLVLQSVLAAVAAETAAESTHDRWTSMKDLSLEPTLVRPLEAPVRLELGPEVLELSGGFLVPVFSGHLEGEWDAAGKKWLAEQRDNEVPRLPSAEERGDHALVGWVWSGGTGAVTVRLDDRADATILANRMVMDLDEDRARWAPVASGAEPLRTGVELAIVLGVAPEIRRAFVGAGELDPYEVVVFGETGAAGRRAADAMRARGTVWETLEQEPGDRISWDRIGVERGVVQPTAAYAVWDLQTTQRYGLVAPQIGGELDRWLSVVSDPSGEHDARRQVRVSARGPGSAGGAVDALVGGVPFPPSVPDDPTSAPLPRVRVEPVEAESLVTVAQTGTGVDLQVTVRSRLTFRAVGGPAGWIDLVFPKMDRVPGSFRFVKVELPDGTPLLGRAEEDVAKAPPPKPEPKPDPGPPEPPEPEPPPEPGEARIRLHLPKPLAAGETVVITAEHEDTWPYAVFQEGPLGMVATGQSSGLQEFLPAVVPTTLGSPWRFHARVAVPATSKLTASVSGRTVGEREEGGWRVVEVESEGHAAYFPGVGVGRYVTVDDPAVQGFPAVRVRAFSSHYGTIDQFGPETRRVIGFYEGYLPPYPVREVEVFEAPARFDGFVWIAPHGMVNLQMMLSTQVTGYSIRDEPHLESAVYAHELAHQYWGHLAPPATVEDFWIAESFSELFACLYVSAAFEQRDCALRMEHKREAWESADAPPNELASLSRAYASWAQPRIVYDYGPYLLGEMLIRRIGQQAFFSAVDVMLRERAWEPLTTERLEGYLSLASGQDLGPFFDFWVHGGRLPKLTAEWTTSGSTVTGTVRADVPFGTFDVPVVVRGKDSATSAMVTVTDGVGTFTIEAPPGKPVVLLDPDRWVLARSREVQRR